jgi:hypothetical protein
MLVYRQVDLPSGYTNALTGLGVNGIIFSHEIRPLLTFSEFLGERGKFTLPRHKEIKRKK